MALFVETCRNSCFRQKSLSDSNSRDGRDVLQGFHGLPRSPCRVSCEVSDPQVGLISPPHSLDWNPMSISWDGSSQLYFTDSNEGAIYTVPSLLAMQQEMVKFADAPYCHGIAILLGTGSS